MVGVVIAFAVALAWCVLSLWLGPALGFVDRPDDVLKTHRTPAVPLGGVGVFLGVLAGSVVEGFISPWLAVAMAILLVLGLVDDRAGLDPRVRLLVEAVAGVVLALGAVPGGFGPVERVVVVILVVAAVNAVNLFDGLDGLLGSVALVTGVALFVHGIDAGGWCRRTAVACSYLRRGARSQLAPGTCLLRRQRRLRRWPRPRIRDGDGFRR